MDKIFINTSKKREVLDITDKINEFLARNAKNENFLCHIFLLHTTSALTTADLDPGTDSDMLNAFLKMIPDLEYKHLHNPKHVPNHLLSSLIGTSLSLPVSEKSLVLGTWQRVVLIEFDGPREREIVINLI